MSNRKVFYISERTADWITSTTAKLDFGEKARWSVAVNATVDQFRYLLRESLPDLDIEEWTIILNVYAGCYFPAHGIPARIASDMLDNVGVDSIEDITNEDYKALAIKVYGMTQIEQFAILYFVQIFFANKWNMEWDDIVAAIKSKF